MVFIVFQSRINPGIFQTRKKAKLIEEIVEKFQSRINPGIFQTLRAMRGWDNPARTVSIPYKSGYLSDLMEAIVSFAGMKYSRFNPV